MPPAELIVIGTVNKVRHAILGQFLPPPLSHFVIHPGTTRKYVTHLGPPIFSRPSTKKPGQKPPVGLQILSQLFTGLFVRGFCPGVFCLEGFVRGGFCPFPLVSEYICYNRKLKITLNFMFQMYNKKCISRSEEH